MPTTTPQSTIKIGTLVPADGAPAYIDQILPHGFESFQINNWRTLNGIDLVELAPRVLDSCGDKAIISSIGIFGNPLQDEETRSAWESCIDAAHLYGCDLVAGFSGALEDRPVPDSMPRFKEVWSELARRAEDKGVRIAWENCDMGGNWEAPRFNLAHSPAAWEMMFNEVPSPALGLEWEPCHQMKSLIDPLPQLRKWVGKIFHIHGKDGNLAWDVIREYGIRSGKPYMWHRTPGMGDTNWNDVLTILRLNKWEGSIDIEGWHDPIFRDELEMTGQVFSLNYLKACRGGAFVPNPVK
jgi:sugar phosphate isomerase/epimerase